MTEHVVPIFVFAVPPLNRESVQVPCAPVPAEHVVTDAVTCAVLVNDPNRPNTNPAMAMAAMRVIAMRITVASTGDIALRLPDERRILCTPGS